MVKNSAFSIGGMSIAPGTREVIELPIARLYTHTAINLPVHVINGQKPGPCLFISAAIHGDELNGVEIIRRVLQHKSLSRLRGTLIAIPIVNVFGLVQHSRYLPDRRDLNRSFPGSMGGSLAARLAKIFLDSIVQQCTHGIDLHTGALHRSNLPQIRANLDDEQTREFASAFGVPVLINANLRDGSLRQAAAEFGIPMLVYEAGEALRFDEFAIRAGFGGVIRAMRSLSMLPASETKSKRKKPAAEPFIARSSTWVRSPHSGMLQLQRQLGDQVAKGEELGVVTDPSDMFEEYRYVIKANASGVIIGRTNLPLVSEGDALYHIARFEDSDDVAAELESFQQALLPDD